MVSRKFLTFYDVGMSGIEDHDLVPRETLCLENWGDRCWGICQETGVYGGSVGDGRQWGRTAEGLVGSLVTLWKGLRGSRKRVRVRRATAQRMRAQITRQIMGTSQLPKKRQQGAPV